MFSAFLKEISGYFDRRFLLSAFFPALAFAGLNLAMLAAWRSPTLLLAQWRTQPAEVQSALLIGALSCVLFIAFLFHIFQTSLMRFYEGDWSELPVLGRWGEARRSFHKEIWQYLEDEVDRLWNVVDGEDTTANELATSISPSERERLQAKRNHLERELFLFYPREKAYVAPTRLGNILRAAEFYAYRRYGLDAVVAWPRLQNLLPQTFTEDLRNAKANLDLLLVVTTLSALFAAGWQFGLGFSSDRWDLFIWAGLGWMLALLGHFGMLQAAGLYGELIKAAFDLHRWRLFEALHLELPESYDNERKLWREVNELLYRSYPPDQEIFRYTTERPTFPEPPPSLLTTALSTLKGHLKRLVQRMKQWLEPPSDDAATDVAVEEPETATTQERQRPIDRASWLIWFFLVLIVGASAYAISRRPPATTTVWAPVQDLPAYYLIAGTDVMTKTAAISLATENPVSASDALELRYTRQPLSAGQTIQESQLVPVVARALVSDTVPVPLPATAAMAFNGRLATGAIVTVWTVTDAEQVQPLLEEALVLDVQKAEGQSEPEEQADPYVIVLAVPRSKRAEIVMAGATGALSLTLVP